MGEGAGIHLPCGGEPISGFGGLWGWGLTPAMIAHRSLPSGARRTSWVFAGKMKLWG